VTGATGFIGHSLCKQLLSQGFAVRILARSPMRAAELESLGATVVQGDLDNSEALVSLISGCSAIIHGAGVVRGNSQADFDRVNVQGTENLVSAICASGQSPRLLLLSSLVAREPNLSWYSRSKHGGEQALLRAPSLDWVILRPPAVYGPGDQEMLPIFQLMRRGIALVPGSPDARISLIHVTDLVCAIIACLQSTNTRGLTLSLDDGKSGGYSWREMSDIAADLWSRKIRLWRVPQVLLNSVAVINTRMARITGRAPMLTPPKLRELRHEDWVVENTQIQRATGWEPNIQLKGGLNELGI
ncbi:MAG: SDR family NAD(P)-dependent oxidoreductase, partial [Halieaceae bacterium]|nr:SDR family NAD(P)-dependent oxidoreductase [Halieaceae bacterium]